ncbi:MAG: DUF2723 domain-containing protein [Prevotella sp.]|nr:DUF2723 domain-containing protein [Prevotella sp.]
MKQINVVSVRRRKWNEFFRGEEGFFGGEKGFRRIDNIMGWLVFLLAAWVYGTTIEPTASFWDCPEFILCGYKLEVGHPPGAPFYMIVANVASQLASDPSQVALMINLLNALLSAATIMFLYWTITHLFRKICKGTILSVLCGLVGSIIYCFSDTFWFSAVEGEVYAFSSLMTAVVFWLILKWEDHADEPHSDRYLVLIAYLIGLSIGIHLLCLLCLPAVVLVWYYRRHPDAGLWGSLKALLVSFVLLGGVLYGVIPGVVKGAEWAEKLFVGVLGWKQNLGALIYVFLLFSAISSGLWYTFQRGLRLWNTALLCLLVLLIGYASYALILIRSSANPPMDQNSPDKVQTLASYLARDQYGQRPLLYGQAYTSQPEYEPVPGTNMMRMKIEDGEFVYAQKMFFPRMWDSQKTDVYENWMGGIEGRMVPYDYGGEMMLVKMPTQWENLKFFLSYQCNFMYWRYFMWNFCGRQNDIQGQGEVEHGNWITGIPFIDNLRLGNQEKLPGVLKQNKGYNVYYGLPFLLGFIGLLWQGLRRGHRGIQQFWVVFTLFFMTGLAIVVYLNQNPMQVRERDYSYAGSFYAYAIWCGLGVAAIHQQFSKWFSALLKNRKNRLVVPMKWAIFAFLMMLIPLQMATQNWDDHDRSHRFACRDFGQNYLNSCQQEGNPILFCDGDNDTFPLWYNQEVENVRTDIRVCNLNYLPTDWYIDQQCRPNEDAPALPIPWAKEEYHGEAMEGILINAEARQQVLDFYAQHPDEARKQFGEEPFELHNILRYWVRSEDPDLRFIPTDTVYLNVDKQAVRESGMMAPDGRRASELSDDEIPDRMVIPLSGRRGLHKGQLAFLEVLANSNWRRPVYVCVSVPSSQYLGLDEYLVTEGFAARFTPFPHDKEKEVVDTERTYQNLMTRFRFGNINRPGIYLDTPTMQMCSRARMTFAQLAVSLKNPADREKVLRKCDLEIPEYNLPLTYETGGHLLARAWAMTDQKQMAFRHIDAVWKDSIQHLEWVNSMDISHRNRYHREYQRHCAIVYYLLQLAQNIDPQRAEQMRLQAEGVVRWQQN